MFDAVSAIGVNLASRFGVTAAKAGILTKMLRAIGAADVVEETSNPHRAVGQLKIIFWKRSGRGERLENLAL